MSLLVRKSSPNPPLWPASSFGAFPSQGGALSSESINDHTEDNFDADVVFGHLRREWRSSDQ